MRIAAILHHIARRSPAMMLTALLAACGGQPDREQAPIVNTPISISELPVTEDTVEGPYAPALMAAANQLQRGELIPAAASLGVLAGRKLHATETAQLRDLQVKLHYLRGDIEAARQLVDKSLLAMAEFSQEQKWHFQQWRQRLLKDSGAHLQSARETSQLLDDTVTDSYRAVLREQIWQDLQKTPLEKIQIERQQPISASWRGWLELTLIYATDTLEPGLQDANWRRWQNTHSNHPAALHPPPGVADKPSALPAKVALILPLSGDLAAAGQAISDGYMAAMYSAIEQGWPKQEVRLLDINNHSDINGAYQQASDLGAELIVGPLTKAALQNLKYNPEQRIPVLALNRLELAPQDSRPLFQLALAPDDEANQLAKWAYARGARNALIVRPNSTFGATMSEHFARTWSAQTGRVAAEAIYQDQSSYSSSIRKALELAASEERASKIRQLMDAPFEFTPRRRRDIDSIFLLTGQPQEARSLKPLLAFHYAGDLPIYSTSYIFSGRANPQQDRDLNNTRLLEMPWFLNEQNPTQKSLAEAEYQDNLAAMYALGADAFALHWRLRQMQGNTGQSVRGQTGLLSMDAAGRVHRELRPARIRRGVPVAHEG